MKCWSCSTHTRREASCRRSGAFFYAASFAAIAVLAGCTRSAAEPEDRGNRGRESEQNLVLQPLQPIPGPHPMGRQDHQDSRLERRSIRSLLSGPGGPAQSGRQLMAELCYPPPLDSLQRFVVVRLGSVLHPRIRVGLLCGRPMIPRFAWTFARVRPMVARRCSSSPVTMGPMGGDFSTCQIPRQGVICCSRRDTKVSGYTMAVEADAPAPVTVRRSGSARSVQPSIIRSGASVNGRGASTRRCRIHVTDRRTCSLPMLLRGSGFPQQPNAGILRAW